MSHNDLKQHHLPSPPKKEDPYEKWNQLRLTEKIQAQNSQPLLLLPVYHSNDILEQIFDEEWVKKNKTTIDNYIGKSKNPIKSILLLFFQLNNENKEYLEKEYLRLIDYIRTTCSLITAYSVSYYLNKLDQIYKYKLEYTKKKLLQEEEKKKIIFPSDDGIKFKSNYEYENPLTKIFDDNWRLSVGIKSNMLRLITDYNNSINNQLLEFFQFTHYSSLSDTENIELFQHTYIRIFNYIKSASSLYPQYSEKMLFK
jgi:hypothetical protein